MKDFMSVLDVDWGNLNLDLTGFVVSVAAISSVPHAIWQENTTISTSFVVLSMNVSGMSLFIAE